jgi:hypothetical protein
MSGSVVVLLDWARKRREAAAQARRLAQSVTDSETVAKLERYAVELEERAHELEERAYALAEAVAKNQTLTTDLGNLVAAVHERLKGVRSHPARPGPERLSTPTLRDFAERCRQLAASSRSRVMREHLLALARDMEHEAATLERRASGRNLDSEAC